MSQIPGESAEQWSARASAAYYAAWDALAVDRRRGSTTGIEEGQDPAADEHYDRAIDRLQAADCERGDAAIAVDRERRIDDRAQQMRADLDHRMIDQPHNRTQDGCPAYDDFRRGNNQVDRAPFTDALTAWDDGAGNAGQ